MISAGDAKKMRTEDDNVTIALAERTIDNAIRISGDSRVVIDMNGIRGLTTRVREHLKEMYERGGWTAEWSSGDQREPGPFFTLTAGGR